jgi:hypothetical protein
MAQIVDWKKKVECNGFQNFLIMTFQKQSKNCGYLNPWFVKQIFKKVFEAYLKFKI